MPMVKIATLSWANPDLPNIRKGVAAAPLEVSLLATMSMRVVWVCQATYNNYNNYNAYNSYNTYNGGNFASSASFSSLGGIILVLTKARTYRLTPQATREAAHGPGGKTTAGVTRMRVAHCEVRTNQQAKQLAGENRKISGCPPGVHRPRTISLQMMNVCKRRLGNRLPNASVADVSTIGFACQTPEDLSPCVE